MKRKLLQISLCFLSLLMFGGVANASVLIFDYTGTVTDIEVDEGSAPAGIDVGDTITGFFAYDTAALDSIANTNVGYYILPEPAVIEWSFTAGGHTFRDMAPPLPAVDDYENGSVSVYNDSVFPVSGDVYSYIAELSVSGDNFEQYTNFLLGLIDTSSGVFSGDALPLALNIADFDYSALGYEHEYYGYGAGETNIFTIEGSVNGITKRSDYVIPEPSSLFLISAGLLGIGIFRWKRGRFYFY